MNPNTFTHWRTSSHSSGGANCLQVSTASDGTIGLRGSKDPTGPVLTFRPAHWSVFTQVIREGGFDLDHR